MKEEHLPLYYLETDMVTECAICYKNENFGIETGKPEIVCTFSAKNNQCIGKRCPFSAVRAGSAN